MSTERERERESEEGKGRERKGDAQHMLTERLNLVLDFTSKWLVGVFVSSGKARGAGSGDPLKHCSWGERGAGEGGGVEGGR